MNDKPYDICFVGSGLSCSSVIYNLFSNDHKESIGFKKILIIEKNDSNLWRGIPYGGIAKNEFFLIETLRQAPFPIFEEWLLNNRRRLHGLLIDNNEILHNWYGDNKDNILSGNILDIYFPRYIFGFFINEIINNIRNASDCGFTIDISYAEVTDIDRHSTNKYRVTTSENIFFLSRYIVMAIGSIPKHHTVKSKKYFTDSEFCAVYQYDDIAKEILAGSNDQSLVIVGASASALELLYFISNNDELLLSLRNIYIISNSGRLIDGLCASDFDALASPDYVLMRRSSDIYRKAVSGIAEKITIIKARVKSVEEHGEDLSIVYSKDNSGDNIMRSNIVINCSGSGSLDNTNSPLLNNLKEKFPVTEERRGFEVNDNNQVIGCPGFFVVGPLLNRAFSSRQVESIPAVFREAKVVAEALINVERNPYLHSKCESETII